MSVTAKKAPSRLERLLQAKELSNKIHNSTVAAEITNVQIEDDVRKAFNDVKASRTSRNRH